MRKKAQIKFGESIGVIIIVYFVIFTGLIWYNNINTKNLNELYEKDQKNRAFEKYYFLINSNLIHVSQRGYVDKEFDIYSLKALEEFNKNPKNKDYLDSYLGNSKVEITIYEKELQNPQTLIIYDNSPTNTNLRINSEIFRTLIPIKDTVNGPVYLGILELTKYNVLS